MAGQTGWNHVDKPQVRGGRFFSINDGETKTVRILDEEPYTRFVHNISQPLGEDGEEIFQTIPATPDLDDDFISAHTNRYPALPRHSVRVLVFDEDGEPDGIKVLEGGVQIFRPLKRMFEKHGTVTEFDVEITREGEGRKTSYEVSAAPVSNEIDLEDWVLQVEEDEALAWESIYPDVTPEDQEKMLDEAGLDIDYDPVAEIKEELTLEDALEVRVGFGQYGKDKFPPSGKTIQEIAAIDTGYLEWAAENVTSDDLVAAACQIALDNMEALERPKGQKAKRLKKGKKAKPDPEPEPEEEEEEYEDEPEDDDYEEEEDGDDEPEAGAPTRKDWPLNQDIESYLDRWHGRGGKHVKLGLQILEAEGTPYGEAAEEEQEKPSRSPKAGKKTKSTAKAAPAAKKGKKTAKKGKKTGASREDLKREVAAAFANNSRFKDAREIVKAIKQASNGKTRVKDLTDAQLVALLVEIEE